MPVWTDFIGHCLPDIRSTVPANSRRLYTRPCKYRGARCVSSLAASRALAQRRAEHTASRQPTFQDAYAAALAAAHYSHRDSSRESKQDALDAAFDIAATKFVDEQVLTAVGLVNMDMKEEYRQVVFLGCGMDTRPYRLLWPEGTLLFEIANKQVHERANEVLRQQKALVPRGCLFRRVPCDLERGESFIDTLKRAGYRPDRLSVWGVQGLEGLGLSLDAIRQLWTQISMAAAFDSIILGELPSMSRAQADNLLGEHAMLGLVKSIGETGTEEGDLEGKRNNETSRWLFTSQHKQLSIGEESIYAMHVESAEDVDEDFFDNFS